MRRRTTALAVIALVATGAGLLTAPGASAAGVLTFTVTREGHTVKLYRVATPRTAVTGTGATRADFDGDGVDDLASTAAGADTSALYPHGEIVIVKYSSTAANDVLAAQFGNGSFGDTLAAGNFDGDRYDDLVIGAQSEPDSATDADQAGGVWVVPGSASGLDLARTVHVDQDTPGVPEGSEPGDTFGASLATGDLTGDGRDDLAVGNPAEDLGTARNAGTVTVLKGSVSGLTTTGAVLLHQNLSWVPGAAETGDSFGAAVAIGRVDRGANADLVIGTTWENGDAGMVTLVRGAAGGVSTTGVTGVTGTAAAAAHGDPQTVFNHFGGRLAIGDTTGDGLGEVVVGVGGTNMTTSTTAFLGCGAVVVLAGHTTGLSASGLRVLHQDSPGVPGTRASGDGFGTSVSAGDVTGDGRADVLVGVPGEHIGRLGGGGAVVLLRGAASGLTGTGSQLWSQASTGVPGAAETGDAFGVDVALLNLDGRGGLDAAVTAPGEQLDTDPSFLTAGSVTTFTGSSAGLVPRVAFTGASFRTADFRVIDYGRALVERESAI
ncbi:FG-GAP repeat protein [Kineosporia sp. R_H_3]|uniref:FG-GAP repeat protein n=1 Tax=Kineosporia sp. R_H_3 TaxID=1961848 RepID=UPI000B4BAE2F|nr:FG-GAP repeat protein [Kineosporia sp. R_H_3]